MTTSKAPQAFASAAKWRAWLTKHHASERELLVRCFKVEFAARGATYKQALDEALCFGWIDGVRRSIDAESFSVRFTPRKPGSRWSLVNIRFATALETAGRMHPSGLAAFRARDLKDARRYSFESRTLEFSAPLAKKFRAVKGAWEFFSARPPGYRRTATFWVMGAKQAATQERRLETLIDCSARGLTLQEMTPARKRRPD